MPLRLVTRLREAGVLALMPAWLDEGPTLGVKCITNFPENPARGVPAIGATVLLLDAQTGTTKAIMDGTHITAVRTAAASAIATDLLARRDASRLTLVGAGVQAASHLEAMTAVRKLRSVHVASRTLDSAERFVREHAPHHDDVDFVAVESPDEAVQDADIICAVSASPEPVFRPSSVAPGTHINGVGSHTPNTREIPGETMRDARVVVDSREASLRECGDCMIPISEGLFGHDHVADELGEVLAGTKPGARATTRSRSTSRAGSPSRTSSPHGSSTSAPWRPASASTLTSFNVPTEARPRSRSLPSIRNSRRSAQRGSPSPRACRGSRCRYAASARRSRVAAAAR